MAESHHEDNSRKGSSTSRKKRRCPPDDDLKLCTAYLYRKDGCPRGEECNFLHMCRYYMLQCCRAGRTCQFSHDLLTRQCQAWFQRRFGIGRVQGEMLHQFRELFKAAMCRPPKDKTSDESAQQNWKERQRSLERLRGFLARSADAEKESAVGESLQTDEDKVSRSAETSYAAKTAQTHRGRQKPKGDKTGKVCIPSKSSASDTNQTTDSLVSSTALMTSSSSVNAPTVKPESSPELPPQICLCYLRGNCSFSEQKHQKYRHCAHPFQWEIQDGMRGIWLDLTDQANVTLEQHFCNVTNAEYSGQLIAYCGENRENFLHVRTATITFGVVTLAISDKSGKLTDVRRLSSMSSTQAGGWRKTYSTQWTWYWQDGQKKWIEYPQKKPDDSSLNTTNDTIENKYQKFRQQKGPAGIEITTDQGKWRLDFSHMKQTSLSEGPAQVQPLARRPKWKPTSNQCPSDAPSVPVVEVNSTVKASLPQKTPEESRAPMKKPLEPKLSVTQQIDHSRKPGAHNVLNSKTQDVPVSSDSKELNKPQLSACPSQKQHPDVFDSKKPQGAPIQETASSNGTRFKTLGAFVRPTEDRALHQDVDSQLQEPSSLTAESKSGSLPRLTKVASPGSSADKVVTNKSDASPGRDRKECLEICLHYLKGSCQVEDDKYTHKRHFTTPYQWQESLVQSGRCHWRNCSSAINDYLEYEYSDVACDIHVKLGDISLECGLFGSSGTNCTHRRLSTPSSVLASSWEKAFSIEWIWYWLDEKNKWIAYSEKNPKGERAGINSATIERKYLNYKSKREDPEIEFTAGRQHYKLDFAAMHQTNVRYGTCRKVRRRPKIVSMEERTRLSSVPVVEVNSTVKASLLQKTPEESRAPMKKPLEPKLSVTQQIDHSRKPGAHNVLNSKTQDVTVSSDSKELNKPQLSACPSQKQHPDVFDSKKPQGAPIQETASSNGTRFKTQGAFVRPTGDRALHQDVDSQLQEPSSLTAESKSGSLPRLTKVASPGSSADKVVTNKSDASPGRDRKECLEICLHYLKGSCQVEDDKYTHKRHFATPYQWQVNLSELSGGFLWRNCPPLTNDCMEEVYCDVKIDCPVELRDMLPECEVFSFINSLYRRLSTPSSVLASSWEKAFSIEWIWYWLDEKDQWIAYSEKNPKGERAGINSATIERKYLNYKSKREDPEIEFTAGSQNYKLDFAAMHQTNMRYGTCRKVRRRPKFVPMEERKILSRRLSEAPKVGHIVPATWEGAATQTDMELVPLTDHTSTEYKDIAKLFEATMDTRGSIISIKRVQNMELWEDFTKMSERMRKRNDGSPVLQMQLLHGTTTRSHAHAICRQNFDWRLSGSNVGTVYGKGSYFALDAEFAHRYTKPNDKNNRYLLVAQVLVGSCATGSPVYTRPPPKDPLKPHGDLYDSCVNNMTDPAIFVIFEKNQAYPEYLIKYKEKPGYELASLGGSSSALAAFRARLFLKP